MITFLIYLPAVFAIVFVISLFTAFHLESIKHWAVNLALVSVIASLLISVGGYIYEIAIADVNVECYQYEVVDIRQDGEKNMLVLKDDQGGYFEKEASLADQYEISTGDDYYIVATISTLRGVTVNTNAKYAYTCNEGPIERTDE